MTYDDDKYTVILNKITDNRYRGEATNRVTQDKIDVAAKVYVEDDNNEIIIVGTKWLEGGINYKWCLMLENVD